LRRLTADSGSANFATLLFDSATRAGTGTAVIERGAHWTYEQQAGRAGAFAETLAASGVRPGQRVCILLPRGAESAAAFFGALACGAVVVLVGDSLRARQVEHVVNNSGAEILISSSELLSRLSRGLDVAAEILEPRSVAAEGALTPHPRIANDVAQIIYTSGSTGLPKGVTISHANLWAGMRAVTEYLHIAAEDRIASLLAFSFDYGLNQLLCAVGTGACLVIERSPVPGRLVRTLERERVSVVACVPPLWLQLLATDDFRLAQLDSLRAMTNSGGKLPVGAVRTLRSCHKHADLVLMYGLTEAFRSTYLDPALVDRKPDSIGQAIPGAEILVLDDDLNVCPPGVVGQLVHRGPTVALGYWNDPEASAEVFRPDPFPDRNDDGERRVVFSGDLAYRDEDGDLFFVGRRDSLIKTLGYRVSPDEVVEALHASGEIVEAVVTSEPDEVRGARIVAHVVLSRDGSVERLKVFAAHELPRYMQPARIEACDELPRSAHGKHDAKALTQGT
jgi:amino acid adenylation domain-containing protein